MSPANAAEHETSKILGMGMLDVMTTDIDEVTAAINDGSPASDRRRAGDERLPQCPSTFGRQ